MSKSKTEYKLRAQQLSESQGGRPELPAPNTSNCPYDVCGRKATLDEEEDNKTARTKDKRRGTCSKLVKCANNNFCDRALREVLTEAGCFSRDLVRDTLHFHLPIHYLYTTFPSAYIDYISICLAIKLDLLTCLFTLRYIPSVRPCVCVCVCVCVCDRERGGNTIL